MKPKNFPARKLRRQIQAASRATEHGTLWEAQTDDEEIRIDLARSTRTKKNRSNRQLAA